MGMNVQARGRGHQLRVTHKLLPRPFFHTFPTDVEARSYGGQLLAMLDRGVVPAELLAPAARQGDDPLLSAVMLGYLRGAPHVTPSDSALLGHLAGDIAPVRVSAITYRWVTEHVRLLKGERNLAPGTVRKRIGSMARVLDWHLSTTTPPGSPMPSNPLRALPVGYSQYTPSEAGALAGAGKAAKVDVHRDRRQMPGEHDRILSALNGERRPDSERPWSGPAGTGPDHEMWLLYQVLLHTGLRLREAFTLRVDQVDLERWVLRVEGTKGTRGRIKPRVVPLVPALRPLLAQACDGRVGLLWPYWSGSPADLRAATARLSARFSTLFAYARVPDFSAHDLRHEAACRWFEMRDAAGRWVFSDIEIARIMGWSTLAMALRYASLRGEDLAARLA